MPWRQPKGSLNALRKAPTEVDADAPDGAVIFSNSVQYRLRCGTAFGPHQRPTAHLLHLDQGGVRPMSKSSTPDRVTTHPGEVLGEEFLKPLGMSVNALAMALRVPATRIGAIVKAERALTPATAFRLAPFLPPTPHF